MHFIFCEVQSRNKKNQNKVFNNLCLSLMKSNGLVGVSSNIITRHKLFVFNVIKTHVIFLGFLKALTMKTQLCCIHKQLGLTIWMQTTVANILQGFLFFF